MLQTNLEKDFEKLLATEPTKEEVIEFCTIVLHEESIYHMYVNSLEVLLSSELGDKKAKEIIDKAEQMTNSSLEQIKNEPVSFTKEEEDMLEDIFDSL